MAILFYLEIIDNKIISVAIGLTAGFSAFFRIFSNPPPIARIEKEDISIAADKLLLKYDEKALSELKQAKEQEVQIRNFIDVKSNEIFLLKLHNYLSELVKRKYDNSELAKLIEELNQVEKKMINNNISFQDVELPDRLKKLLKEIDSDQQLNLTYEIIDAIPLLPFKKLLKLFAKTKELRFFEDK